MKISADLRLTHLNEVMAAKEAVRKKSYELEVAMGELIQALVQMGVEISQPTDGAAD